VEEDLLVLTEVDMDPAVVDMEVAEVDTDGKKIIEKSPYFFTKSRQADRKQYRRTKSGE